MKRLGVQLHTVRDFMHTEEDIFETFTKIKKMGYETIQTGGCQIPYKRFGELAKATGLEIVGTHDDFDMMYNDFERSLENHKLLDTTNIGVGGRVFTCVEDVEKFIEQANSVAEKAAKHGMKFTYHNHSPEFRRWANGKSTMEMLVEGLDKDNTSFVLDTYWVQYAGGDVCDWIEMLSGRIDILHLKDMRIACGDDNWTVTPMICEVGNGNMNWKRIIKMAEETGVKEFVVEQDKNFTLNCFASIKQSITYLKNMESK